MRQAEKEKQEALERVREHVKPGDRLYTILRHRSRSGMMRAIEVVKIGHEGVEAHLGWNVAKALGLSYNEGHEGVKVQGCGMDMGFHLVYELSHALFPKGFGCIGKECPSADHNNGDWDYRTHEQRKGRSKCRRCKGEGRADYSLYSNGEELQECRSCAGKGKVGPGHWHRDGGYALRQSWI